MKADDLHCSRPGSGKFCEASKNTYISDATDLVHYHLLKLPSHLSHTTHTHFPFAYRSSIAMLIPTASKIIVNATALVHAFANGMNAFDIPKLQGLLAPGAQYELLPHSLGRPVMPAYDGLAMLAFLKQIVPDFKVSLLDSFHDAQRVKIGVLMFVSVT
jgi:hypothetical protein